MILIEKDQLTTTDDGRCFDTLFLAILICGSSSEQMVNIENEIDEIQQTTTQYSTTDYIEQLITANNDSVTLPSVLKWEKNVILENDLRFDPSACGAGLHILNKNKHLRQNSEYEAFRSCRTINTRWNKGIHYWTMKIFERGEEGRMFVGVINEKHDISVATYVGETEHGYGYYIINNNKYHGGTSSAMATHNTISNGDTIGVLLDLEAETISYFKNGVIMGTAFGELSTGNLTIYYPAVSFYEKDQWIGLMDTVYA